MNDEQLEKRKILDTANRAYSQGIYQYTDFLSLTGLDLYARMNKELSFIKSRTFGGYEGAERQMVEFGSEDLYGYPGTFPITILYIHPLIKKFAENLEHRDFLGALMNLGIRRETCGDVVIDKENHAAYVFTQDHMAEYIKDRLDTVRHTHVAIDILDEIPPLLKPKTETFETLAASYRIDAVCASLMKVSRSKVLAAFRAKEVFLNGRCIENNSCNCKPDDVLVIRHFGKFILGEARETRSGRMQIKITKYIIE